MTVWAGRTRGFMNRPRRPRCCYQIRRIDDATDFPRACGNSGGSDDRVETEEHESGRAAYPRRVQSPDRWPSASDQRHGRLVIWRVGYSTAAGIARHCRDRRQPPIVLHGR